jgi:RNA polymerase sigma-70 factor (ECF subfamily)
MEKPKMEDAELVERVLAGDSGSFEALVERYQVRLFGLARHYTKNPVEVEDLVQDTLLKAYSRLSSFQRQSSFYTWLYRIGTNTILDWLKRQGRNPVQAVEDPELAPARDSVTVMRPEGRLEQQETARITHEVMQELPEIFRTVLILREFEDLAYQDIADVLGISIGTVESRLFRARARFKQKILQLYPEFAQA